MQRRAQRTLPPSSLPHEATHVARSHSTAQPEPEDQSQAQRDVSQFLDGMQESVISTVSYQALDVTLDDNNHMGYLVFSANHWDEAYNFSKQPAETDI